MLARQTEQHLQAACRWIEVVLNRQVLRLRSQREETPEEFQGLCIADAEIDLLLAAEPGGAPTAWPEDVAGAAQEEAELAASLPESRLSQIAARFGLDDLERRVLILAAAPELDLRYQTLFAYVQNDITRKLATVDLLLKLLCGSREDQWQGRRLFAAQSPLFNNTLLQVVADNSGRDTTQLARSVRVAPRVVEFLLGQTSLDDSLNGIAALIPDGVAGELPANFGMQLPRLITSLHAGGLVVLRGRDGIGKLDVARAVCGGLSKRLIVCDLRGEKEPLPAGLLVRECKLLDAALYLQSGVSPPEKQRQQVDLAKALAAQSFPIFLSIEDSQAPALDIACEPCFRFEFALPEVESRRLLWARELNLSGRDSCLGQLAAEFRFTPGQIRAVAREARSIKALRSEPGPLNCDDVRQAARNRCNINLRGLADRVDLRFGWDDLILPSRVLQQLQEICASVNLRHVVQTHWGFDAKTGKDSGISVLFAGASGTGKTMAAGVLARSLGMELYKVDLSCVVSKYVGETERNLGRIFDEAEHSSAVLFFDEADALFGKRSEVKDAQDRYANIEVAYLLQKMEQFPGLAVLATNLSRNMDTAFQRRLQHVVEFPFPDVVHRERIWRAMFPNTAPRSADVDFDFLARQFELSGGNIRNAVTAGAFLAAEQAESISMEHLVRAVGREMQKIGKLPSKAQFQGHMDVISRQSSGRT